MGANSLSRATAAAAVVPLALILVLIPASDGGKTHIVGGTIWSLPPSNSFYQNWSNSQTFFQNDFLYFDFESGMYNVHDVDRAEYTYCEATRAYNSYEEGPALHKLEQIGTASFVNTILDHCFKGLRFSVFVNRITTASTSTSTPPDI